MIKRKQRIEVFSEKLQSLTAEMEYFYNASRKDREALRKNLRDKIQKFHIFIGIRAF